MTNKCKIPKARVPQPPTIKATQVNPILRIVSGQAIPKGSRFVLIRSVRMVAYVAGAVTIQRSIERHVAAQNRKASAAEPRSWAFLLPSLASDCLNAAPASLVGLTQSPGQPDEDGLRSKGSMEHRCSANPTNITCETEAPSFKRTQPSWEYA